LLIAGIFLSFLDAKISDLSWTEFLGSEEVGPTASIFHFVTLIPSITVCARRFHDIDRSGWWMLIVLTIVGIIPFIYWVCKEGDKGENRFGPNSLTSVRSGAPANISTSSAATDVSQNPPLSEISTSDNAATDQEQELKKIEDMFEKSIITEDEKIKMRNKVLGLG
jgi:hypothetical protein